jgi:lysozyme family protein
MATAEEIAQARFEAWSETYEETFEDMETRLNNLEKMVKKKTL